MPRSQVAFADPHEVADFVADLSDKYLECRDTGHNWRRLSARWSPHVGEYRRVHRCRSCRAERTQHLSDKGAILRVSINYPDGYLHEGLGRIVGDGRDVLRLQSMERTAVTDDEE